MRQGWRKRGAGKRGREELGCDLGSVLLLLPPQSSPPAPSPAMSSLFMPFRHPLCISHSTSAPLCLRGPKSPLALFPNIPIQRHPPTSQLSHPSHTGSLHHAFQRPSLSSSLSADLPATHIPALLHPTPRHPLLHPTTRPHPRSETFPFIPSWSLFLHHLNSSRAVLPPFLPPLRAAPSTPRFRQRKQRAFPDSVSFEVALLPHKEAVVSLPPRPQRPELAAPRREKISG